MNGANGTLHVAGLNIPAETLAGLAYSQLTTAGLGEVTLDPQGANDTNLPTFVDVTLRQPRRGVLEATTKGVPYVWATAETPAGEAATVYAWVTAWPSPREPPTRPRTTSSGARSRTSARTATTTSSGRVTRRRR